MKTPSTLADLQQQVQRQYSQLSPQFKQISRYMFEHRDQVATLSARKLAPLIGVKPATLVRLAQHLGYPGWEALKAVFIRGLYAPGSANTSASLLSRHTHLDSPWQACMAQFQQNLQALEPGNQASLLTVIKPLKQAKYIWIAGFRASYPAAFSLRYLCSQFRADVHLLHNTGGSMPVGLGQISSNDALVVIGQQPYAPEALQLAQTARAQDCTIIAICDSPLAPIAQEADHILTFQARSPNAFRSSVALQALVEILAQQLLMQYGEAALSELKRTSERLGLSP